MASDLGKNNESIVNPTVESSLETSASSTEVKELSASEKCSNIFIIYDHKGKLLIPFRKKIIY
jgi:hypothetical protein